VRQLPTPSKSNKVLGFCFVDPYKMANLKFSTIEALSRRFMDFLVLIPSGMDAHRNEGLYVREGNRTVGEFVGNPDWRAGWRAEKSTGKTFEAFIVEEFGRSMSRLKYPAPSLEKAAVIRSDEKNLLLYRLMLYSRHQLAGKFWQQAKKYTNPQAGFEGF
jgi:three-Cys-motif partner protein